MPTNPAKPTTRKRTAKQPSKAEQARRAQQRANAKPDEEEIPLEHGVVVWRVEAQPGVFNFVVQTLGDVKPTEITDTLSYGIKVNKEQRGLD